MRKFYDFMEQGKVETANRILDIFPPCDFKEIHLFLLRCACPIDKGEVALTENQIQKLLDRSTRCPSQQFYKYYKDFRSLWADIPCTDDLSKKFHETHSRIIDQIVKKTDSWAKYYAFLMKGY
jgi:hypothetical protein